MIKVKQYIKIFKEIKSTLEAKKIYHIICFYHYYEYSITHVNKLYIKA